MPQKRWSSTAIAPDDRVHSPGLEVGWDDLQIVKNSPQVMLLQLSSDVLRDEVDCNHVLIFPAEARSELLMEPSEPPTWAAKLRSLHMW